MSDTIPTEVVATYVDGGSTYEIDHLGIGGPNQWGEFVVYRCGEQIAEFSVEAALCKPEHRPPLPDVDALIVPAKNAVAGVRR